MMWLLSFDTSQWLPLALLLGLLCLGLLCLGLLCLGLRLVWRRRQASRREEGLEPAPAEIPPSRGIHERRNLPQAPLAPDLTLVLRPDETLLYAGGHPDDHAPFPHLPPVSLLLGLKVLETFPAHGDAVGDALLKWLYVYERLGRRLRWLVSTLPEQGHGALARVVVTRPELQAPIECWFRLERQPAGLVWRLESVRPPEPLQVLWWQLRARLTLARRTLVVSSLLLSALLTLVSAFVLPFQPFEELPRLLVESSLPRATPSSTLTVLFLPYAGGMARRSDRAVIASVVEACLQRGAMLVGLNLWLDEEGPGAEALAEVLDRHRAQVVPVEVPESPRTGGVYPLAEGFRRRLGPAPATRGVGEQLVGFQSPVAYGGHINSRWDGWDFRTELFFHPRNPDALRTRWGVQRLPLLGTELFRRWCVRQAEPSRCWQGAARWEGRMRLELPRFVEGRHFYRLPELQGQSSEAVGQVLTRLHVPLAGRVVLLSAWDRDELLKMPLPEVLGTDMPARRWPPALLQAAVFHTLEGGRAPLTLREWVSLRVEGHPQGLSGWLAHAGLILLVGLGYGGMYAGFGRGLRFYLLVMGILSSVCWTVYASSQVWLPWTGWMLIAAGSWFWLAQRRRVLSGLER